VPAGGRATVEFPSLDVPYGFSRCEVRIDSGDGFAADDGFLFAVERSDPERVLFVHAANDSRSPLYFGDALGSAAESAFALQMVTLEQVANLPSKYAFVVLSNVAALPASFENELLMRSRRRERAGGRGTSAAAAFVCPSSGTAQGGPRLLARRVSRP
jgi:hypothetical protein